ncbi:FAD/FMN-containing isoamyl alcohol oxidase MreA [Hortaea werneckii]|uniref:FAD-binding PCMH-type domain-containing protein n=1 Tax=Hortaea werneckii TaxID=91943 RepID=A0A3M6YVL1_HORWE|nr:FAD/FMN-containing isoamyl alcohol oxidase MreA [Hortaea werneckii]RMX91720.1 hypothetical protein D0867_14854 [Hortaea werneckii]RMY07054.1 hypothetical protein D0866_14969 [Hortaea werneckii]
MLMRSSLKVLPYACLAGSAVAESFGYEQAHLTSENITQVLNERLPKQSRVRGSEAQDYLSTFLISTTDVTKDHDLQPNYTLAGPNNCKVFPGDEKWPSKWLWNGLKLATLGGLIEPVPLSNVCYTNGTGEIDQDACDELTSSWNNARFISDDPIEVMSPSQVGLTCQPPSLLDTEGCTQGGYPSYTVKASRVDQIQLAVNFARNTGVRFVVKNTGHDFLGKSSGAGSLSVWMHGMKDMTFIPNYSGSSWSGAAIKAGAGVQGFELYDFAHQNDATTIGGLCVTVGILGGWFQGGGHSPLTPLLGMGADQVLSIDVVTSDGRFVTASENENSDLFWALRGGGAAAWGVVTSVTIKAYPTIQAATAGWSFSYPADVSESTFKQAMKSWLSYFPRFADMGLYSYLNVVPAADGGRTFLMNPLVAPNQSLDDTKSIIQPWLNDIKDLGIELNATWNHYDSWIGVANNALTNGSANNYGSITSNRLIPRDNFNGTLFDQTFDKLWEMVQAGNVVLPYNIAPTYDRGGRQDNAVNPAWREAVAYIIIGDTVDFTQSGSDITEARNNFTHGLVQDLRELTPGAGSYGNEGDLLEPNFQWSFFGSFYPRLLELKKRFDPFNVFYAPTTVGSEFFEVRSVDNDANENGPVCVKANPDLYTAEGPEWTAPTES